MTGVAPAALVSGLLLAVVARSHVAYIPTWPTLASDVIDGTTGCVYGYVHNAEIAAAPDPHAGGRPYESTNGHWLYSCGWGYNDGVLARYHTGLYGAAVIDDCR